jgi:hypothetical protein
MVADREMLWCTRCGGIILIGRFCDSCREEIENGNAAREEAQNEEVI